MATTFILTIIDSDGEILFQQVDEDETALKTAAVEWMREQYPDYFDTAELADASREGFNDDYDYIVNFADNVENAPRITIRPVDEAV